MVAILKLIPKGSPNVVPPEVPADSPKATPEVAPAKIPAGVAGVTSQATSKTSKKTTQKASQTVSQTKTPKEIDTPKATPKATSEVNPEPRLSALKAPEKKQLSKYQSKWQKVALSTDRINRKRAAATIKAVYAYANKPAPEILFCESPNLGMLTQLWAQQKVYTPDYLLRKLRRRMNKAIRSKVARSLRIELHDYFFETRLCGFSTAMYQELTAQILAGLDHQGGDRNLVVTPENEQADDPTAHHIERMELSFFAYYDFARQLIDDREVDKEWRLMQAIAKECQWSFMFENVCVICDRPKAIVLPEIGEPRIEFADGTSF